MTMESEERRRSMEMTGKVAPSESIKDELTARVMAEKTPEGKYRCRKCGQTFDTLEAHNEHHRKMHESQPYARAGTAT